jgi:hypothetical protein
MIYGKNMIRILMLALLILPVTAVNAAETTPVGLWKTIDDSSGQVKGLVRIREANGRFEGKIEKIFPKPGDDPAPKCDKCDGKRKNQMPRPRPSQAQGRRSAFGSGRSA